MSDNFFGGLASGIQSQQQQQLEQEKQKALEQNQAKAMAIKQIDLTVSHINELIKAASANPNNDPQKLAAAVEPLGQSINGLAQSADLGVPPDYGTRVVSALLARPQDAQEKKHSVVKIGSDATGDRYGVLEQTSGTVTPIGGQTQTATFPPPPGTVPQQNPQPATAVPATPAPVAAQDNPLPVQRVSMGFPNPAQPDTAAPAPPTGPMLPPGMQPGPEAEDYAIKNSVTGPEFLKTLSPKEAEGTDAITKYKIDPSKLSKRIPKGQTESEYTRGLRRAIQADPNYDPKWYPVMQKTLTEFTTGGPTSPASKITNGNVAIQHLGEIADATDKMAAVPGLLDKIAKSNTSIASYAASRLKNEAVRGTSEGQALAAYLTARNRFAEEITSFYAGQQGADADRQRTIDTLDAAKSTAELYSAMNTEGHLLNSKVNALQDRWKNGMSGPKGLGDVMIRNAIPDFPILSDQSKQSLDRISQGLLKTKGVSGGGAAPNVVDFKTYFGGQ